MPDPPPNYPPDENELLDRWKRAKQFASEADQRAVDAALDVAKEKNQYFEKIALAAGGTIALVVSFVGAHEKRLQPPWLLRSALVTLVVAMIAAMFRNWRYPFYVMDTHGRMRLAARLERERVKNAMMQAAHGRVYNLDGIPVDVPAQLATFAVEERNAEKELKGLESDADAAFKQVQVAEYAAILLMIAAMGMLISLAWRNF